METGQATADRRAIFRLDWPDVFSATLSFSRSLMRSLADALLCKTSGCSPRIARQLPAADPAHEQPVPCIPLKANIGLASALFVEKSFPGSDGTFQRKKRSDIAPARKGSPLVGRATLPFSPMAAAMDSRTAAVLPDQHLLYSAIGYGVPPPPRVLEGKHAMVVTSIPWPAKPMRRPLRSGTPVFSI